VRLKLGIYSVARLGCVLSVDFLQKKQLENIVPGDKLDFFDVEKISENELLLQSSDRHLVVSVSLRLTPMSGEISKISVTTLVYVYNILGVIYMLPVRLVHGVIVRKMLKRVVK